MPPYTSVDCTALNGRRQSENAGQLFMFGIDFGGSGGRPKRRCGCYMCAFPALNWVVVGIIWSRQEVQSVYSMQLQMSRRALQLRPYRDKSIEDSFRRTARWCENVHHSVGVPSEGRSIFTSSWRWTGHLSRLHQRDLACWISKVLHWRYAFYRETIRGLYVGGRVMPTGGAWDEGFAAAQTRRWDEPLQ